MRRAASPRRLPPTARRDDRHRKRRGAMAVSISELLASKLDTLRYEPTAKRLRASLNDVTVADTYQGVLVWEPRRVVPMYAVLLQDLSATLTPSAQTDDG